MREKVRGGGYHTGRLTHRSRRGRERERERERDIAQLTIVAGMQPNGDSQN